MNRLSASIGSLFCLGLSLVSAAPWQPTDFLPPLPEWHGSSEQAIAAPGAPWITPGEATGLEDSPSYEATVAFLRRLAEASPRIKLVRFGTSGTGRALWVVVASKDGADTPAALKANGRPTLLAQAGIHAGEIDGKDAGLMLLRDLAVGNRGELLERANFLFVPILNVDGHERSSPFNRPNQRGPVNQGWRTTAQNLNLNRDYMKVDAPEMRGLLQLITAWDPAFYFDLHVTDGLDYQYDISLAYHGSHGEFAWSPQVGQWLDRVFYPTVSQALTAHGHLPSDLYIDPVENRDVTKGLTGGHMGPRFSHSYGDLRGLPSVLVETHSLKSHRQRVLACYVLLSSTLDLLGREGRALQAAINADREARPAKVPLNWIAVEDKPIRYLDFLGIASETYRSPASGKDEVRWLGKPLTYPHVPVFGDRPGVELARPKAYWVPVTKPEIIERLRLHGIAFDTLAAPRTLDLEMLRLTDPKLAGGARAQAFEGRYLHESTVAAERRAETYPAGSVRVSTDQPLGNLVMALLDPRSDDSFFAWGFFSEVLQRTEYVEGYVSAPMAERMLAENPALKTEFEAKLAADPAFAANGRARLAWFHERSPFHDDRYRLYPVGVER